LGSGSSPIRRCPFRGEAQTEGRKGQNSVSEGFRGEYYQKVDSKARVSIPAAFRRVLDAGDPPTPEFPRTRIVMVYGGKSRQNVECYTQRGAEELSRKVLKLPLGSTARKIAERDLITRSQTVEIDDDGRIVLPQKVRDKIEFGDANETAFAGTLDRFQIWRRDTYDMVNGVFDDEDDELPEGVDVLSLLAEIDAGA